jgi:broad specificity phosphatase PhoE
MMAGEPRRTSLYLIRHGEAEHHVQGRVGGWSDLGLTARGQRQAQALAHHLGKELGGRPCRLICSDLGRAVQTAKAIGQALGVPPQPMQALREHSCGLVDGMPAAEAAAHYIEPSEPLADWVAYPGAETWREVYLRVVPCVEELLQWEGPVLVVTHKIPVHLLLCWWLGLPLESEPSVWFDVDVASVTRLREEAWGAHTVRCVNDTAHLRDVQ